MSSPNSIDLRCRIDRMAEPIEGRLSDELGRSRPFRGWIELAAALTSFAEGAEPEQPNPEGDKRDE